MTSKELKEVGRQLVILSSQNLKNCLKIVKTMVVIKTMFIVHGEDHDGGELN